MINLNKIYWSKRPAKIIKKIYWCTLALIVIPAYAIGVAIMLYYAPAEKRFGKKGK